MTARDRVRAALRGDPVDRPPVSFWGHVYDRESSAADLAQATIEFQRAFGWDWVKLNPRKHYHVEDWGVRYRYSGHRDQKPVLEEWPIRGPGDWSRIEPKPTERGALGEQLEAVRRVRDGLPSDVPLIQTVFTPLAILAEMVPEPADLKRDLGANPEPVRHALEGVTRTFEAFVARVLEAGAEGIYLATTDWASRLWMSPEEYRAWARPFDLRLLGAARGAPFNVLHVCKPKNILFELSDYPVHAFSYDATDPTNPPLGAALPRITGAIMGGISHERALQETDPTAVLEEVRRGFEETGGRRWLVAPGCSIPPTTPAANLHAVRDAVESLAGEAGATARSAARGDLGSPGRSS